MIYYTADLHLCHKYYKAVQSSVRWCIRNEYRADWQPECTRIK